MKSLIEWVVSRAGRDYKVDPDLPLSTQIDVVRARAVEFVRGLLRLGRPCFIGRRVRFRGRRQLEVGHLAAVGEGSYVDAVATMGVKLGDGSKIGRFCTVTSTSHLSKVGAGLRVGARSAIGDYGHIGCSGGVVIGEDVIMGPLGSFHSQEHNSDDLERPIRTQGTTESCIVIGDDVWVGARVTFLAGSRVGSHSIVAAGSVVRGEFPEFSILAGVPARLVRTRG